MPVAPESAKLSWRWNRQRRLSSGSAAGGAVTVTGLRFTETSCKTGATNLKVALQRQQH